MNLYHEHVPVELLASFHCIAAGEDVWIRASANLHDFQATVASAEAWETVGLIRIMEIREERTSGRRLIDALRFRRLR